MVEEPLGAMVTMLLDITFCGPKIACARVQGFVEIWDGSGVESIVVASCFKTGFVDSISPTTPKGEISVIPVSFMVCTMEMISGLLSLGLRMQELPVLEYVKEEILSELCPALTHFSDTLC